METQHFDAKEAFDEGIIQLYGKTGGPDPQPGSDKK